MEYSTLTKQELISIIEESKNENINKSKDLFIANISHDVRTLLNAIYGNAQILESDDSLNTNQKKSVKRIIDASSNMIDLINNIINISTNNGNDKIIISSFNLFEVLNNIYSIFNTIAQSKNILLELTSTIRADYIIKSDKDKLFYILLNLVGNAIKYTKEGKVSINCDFLTLENEILFNIIDTGVGIESEMICEITKDYIRGKNCENIQGYGLGLGIVQKNLLLLGSKLNITTEQDKGSEFSFKIKSTKINKSFETTKDDIFELKKIDYIIEPNDFKVLIYSDNEDEISILDIYFRSRKIVYEIVATLDKFKIKVKSTKYIMIFMELNKIELKDFDFFKEYKNNNKSITFVILTASVMNEDLKRINEISTTYIIEPYSFMDVDQALIMFSNQKFIYKKDEKELINNKLIIDNRSKNSIINEANLGNYKSCSNLINKVENSYTKNVLMEYLDNYDFDEIVLSLTKE